MNIKLLLRLYFRISKSRFSNNVAQRMSVFVPISVGSGQVLSASTDDDTNAQRKLMGIVLGTVGGVLLICLIVIAYLNWVKRR